MIGTLLTLLLVVEAAGQVTANRGTGDTLFIKFKNAEAIAGRLLREDKGSITIYAYYCTFNQDLIPDTARINKSVYDYGEEDARKIFKTIEQEIKVARSRFTDKAFDKFSLV